MTTSTTRANMTRLDLAIRHALWDCARYGYEYTTECGITRLGDTVYEPYFKMDVWAGREVLQHFYKYYNDSTFHSRYARQKIDIACQRILHSIEKLENVTN